MREVVDPDDAGDQLGPVGERLAFTWSGPGEAGQAHPRLGQDPQHGGFGHVDHIEAGTSMGELAVGEVDALPLPGQGHDRLLLPLQERVEDFSGHWASWLVLQGDTTIQAFLPGQYPGVVDPQPHTRLTQREPRPSRI